MQLSSRRYLLIGWKAIGIIQGKTFLNPPTSRGLNKATLTINQSNIIAEIRDILFFE